MSACNIRKTSPYKAFPQCVTTELWPKKWPKSRSKYARICQNKILHRKRKPSVLPPLVAPRFRPAHLLKWLSRVPTSSPMRLSLAGTMPCRHTTRSLLSLVWNTTSWSFPGDTLTPVTWGTDINGRTCAIKTQRNTHAKLTYAKARICAEEYSRGWTQCTHSCIPRNLHTPKDTDSLEFLQQGTFYYL